jgi:hypothetical protein
MVETTRNEGAAPAGADLAAAARDRGMEQLEGAKSQLAEGAERVAAAVDRTSDALEGDADNAISGFGHSVASLMRQLAGGLRERDVEDFARELADLARRNPGVFLAGSVALGFGIARFFKARVRQSSSYGDASRQSTGGWQGSRESARSDRAYDAEEHLDLSANSQRGSATEATGASREDEQQDRNAAKSRQSSKHKAKTQRASSGGSQPQSSSTEASSVDPKSTDATTGSTDSAFTGGTGGGAQRGGKS